MVTTFKPLDLLTIPLDGSNLIEASAGTGKTFTIANLYLRLILEKGYDVRNILVVTFTEAATRELRDRIRRNLRQACAALDNIESSEDEIIKNIVRKYLKSNSVERAGTLLRKAVTGFDEAAIFTIHGFCNRMLSDNAFESSVLFDTELVTDQSALVQEIVDDFWRANISAQRNFHGAVAKKNGLDLDGFLSFAQVIINKPLLKLRPDSVSAAWGQLEDHFALLRQEWKRDENTIMDILYNDKGLKRSETTYRHDVLKYHLDTLERAFALSSLTDALEAITCLAASTIEGAMKQGKDRPEHDFFDLCESFLRTERDLVLGLKLDFTEFLKGELNKRKKIKNIKSFDDLLITLRDSLKAAKGESLSRAIRKNFKAALIDEFQDTDPVQYDIFDMLFAGQGYSLFLIGDPKQSIYGFRGADIFSYIEAVRKTPAGNKYTLDVNWRSEEKLVDGTNRLFNRSANPFVLGDAIGFNNVQAGPGSAGNKHPLMINGEAAAGLTLWFLGQNPPAGSPRIGLNKKKAAEAVVQAVVSEISTILSLSARGLARIGDRPVRPSDFAVLVTRHRDALLFKDPLARLNIPAVFAKTGNVFQTEEAREIELFLQAVAAPGNISRVNAALMTNVIGCTGAKIGRYIEDKEYLEEYEAHIEHFYDYHEMWPKKGFIQMFRRFLSDYSVRQKLLSLAYGQRRLTNLLQLSELIHAASVEKRLGINGILSWISEQKSALNQEKDEQELRLERDDEAVQILTIFKSKGLEYPIVFCPFIWQKGSVGKNNDTIFHDGNCTYLDISADKQAGHSEALAGKELLAELVRVLYVGVTRAQNRCYLACGKIGNPVAHAFDYLFSDSPGENDNIVATLLKRAKGLSEMVLYNEIKDYLGPSPHSIRFVFPEENTPQIYSQEDNITDQALALPVFDGKERISKIWGIVSYSKLTAQGKLVSAEQFDDDLKQDEPEKHIAVSDDDNSHDFFAFPRGAVPGTCIHSIFERIDFTLQDPAKDKVLIHNTLKDYGLDEETAAEGGENRQADLVYEMVRKVVNVSLLPDQAAPVLSAVPAENCIHELEFYYPIKELSPERLNNVFKKAGRIPEQTGFNFQTKIDRLDFRPVQGFMQGFIDLLFYYDDKYYLLDWKTNHLGNSYDDYRPEKLQQNMVDAFYDLQYYIYTVAVHKYLATRISGYDYEQHFGGAFYLFVRGIHPDHPGCGIFFDRPEKKLVEALSALFS